jgi:hypothetical protein
MYTLMVLAWLLALFVLMAVGNAGRTRWQYWTASAAIPLWLALLLVDPVLYGPGELLSVRVWGLFFLALLPLLAGVVVGSYRRPVRAYVRAPSKREIEAGYS